MGNTKIEWAEKAWNPVTGCSKISLGCNNCYAERMSKRLRGRCGYDAENPFKVTLHPNRLEEPLRCSKPSTIFVCSMGDLFHESVPFEWIDKVMAAIALCPQHTFHILTKRPEKMKDYFCEPIGGLTRRNYITSAISHHTCSYEVKPWNLKHMWLGVTAENQSMANKRIPVLLKITATKKFVSVEPMLSNVSLDGLFIKNPFHKPPGWFVDSRAGLDWVICGCESGPKRRPMKIEWARHLRDQCQDAGVPFFMKQLEINGKVTKNINEFPEDLRIREYPKGEK